MARNGSGTYNLPLSPAVSGTTATAAFVNTTFTDLANALTQSLSKDGQTTPTANLPMGGFRLTGLGNATARTDAAPVGQVQNDAYNWAGTAGGTADALTLTPSPAITAYAAGQRFRFIAAADNTGAATVAVSGLTATAIQQNGSALTAGQIGTGKLYEIIYDGTQFQLTRIGTLGLTASDIGVTVQGYDADTTKNDVANTFTALQTFSSGATVSSGNFTTTNLKLSTETPARSLTGIAAAWANLNGTGTIALRDSMNVSGVTDNGTGDYTFTLTAAMANANYSLAVNANIAITTASNSGTTFNIAGVSSFSTVIASNGALVDSAVVTCSVHGDLA